MAFIDEAKFLVKAGNGGSGCVSFRREKFVPRGGPDGGDGGDGGSVILEANRRLYSLVDFRYRSHFIAADGKHGQGKKKHGKNGHDTIVRVPVGTLVRDAETGELLVELLNDQERFLAAQGGKGGLGNTHYASANNRAPRIAGKGKPGVEKWLKVELKLLADIGLVGLPNAGKSTLLSKLSAASPKVASYPFTTLEPQLGVLQRGFGRPVVIADIPGLIENAHQGAGLGIKFLRHIERTRLLLVLVDGAEPPEKVVADLQMLLHELQSYDPSLSTRKRLIVLNKVDLLTDRSVLSSLREKLAPEGAEFCAISAMSGEGLEPLLAVIDQLVEESEVP